MVANLERERDRNKSRISTQNETITKQQRQIALYKGEATELKREKQSLNQKLSTQTTRANLAEKTTDVVMKLTDDLQAQLTKANQIASRDTQKNTIDTQSGKIKSQKGEIDKLKREMQSRDKDLVVANANATGEKRRADQLDKRVKELEAIVKAHKTGRPPVVVATKDPGNGAPKNGGEKPVPSGNCIAVAIPGVPGRFYAELPRLLDAWSPKTKAITVPLVSAPGGLSVKIIPVIKRTPGQPFWSTENAGVVTIHYEKSDHMGIKTQHTVGKAEVKEGKLLWQWQELTFGQSSKHRAELQSLYDITSNSILQVVDGKGKKVTQVQLVSPERAAIKVGQGTKLRPLPRGSKPRLILVGAPGWHLKEDKSGRRIESKNGARIDLVLLEKPQVELKTSWNPGSTLGYINAELPKAKIQIPKLEYDCGKKRAYLTGLQKKSGEKGEDIKILGGQIAKFNRDNKIPQLNDRIKKAEGQLYPLAKRIQELTKQINKNPKNKEFITKLTKTKEALQKEVNGLKAELYKLRARKLPGTEKTVLQAEQELNRLKGEQGKLGGQVKKAKEAVGAADKKLADAKGYKARLEGQKKEIATLTSLQLNVLTQRSDAILGMIVITK